MPRRPRPAGSWHPATCPPRSRRGSAARSVARPQPAPSDSRNSVPDAARHPARGTTNSHPRFDRTASLPPSPAPRAPVGEGPSARTFPSSGAAGGVGASGRRGVERPCRQLHHRIEDCRRLADRRMLLRLVRGQTGHNQIGRGIRHCRGSTSRVPCGPSGAARSTPCTDRTQLCRRAGSRRQPRSPDAQRHALRAPDVAAGKPPASPERRPGMHEGGPRTDPPEPAARAGYRGGSVSPRARASLPAVRASSTAEPGRRHRHRSSRSAHRRWAASPYARRCPESRPHPR